VADPSRSHASVEQRPSSLPSPTLALDKPAPRGTLLVIDDSATARALVVRTIESQALFERVVQAKNGAEGLELAATCHPDVVLCDINMPVLDGFGFLERFRGDAKNRNIPVLLLSAEGDSESRLRGFACGANDYVNKPAHPVELTARVANSLRLKLAHDDLEQAVLELANYNEKLEHLATTDGLTGLCNRRHFLSRATDELSRALRYRHGVAFTLIDIDHFKSINDGCGHPAGDRTLVAVAEALKKSLRSSDLVARFGGEEFVVMLPETTREGAERVAEKLRNAVRELDIPDLKGRRVTISAGVALLGDGEQASLEDLIKHADEALYSAKAGGRDRVELSRGRT
jgi:two-component system, cell cycle response regulator